ncbi:MAG: hypothetical protein ACJ74D_10615 [Gaiellaceae bacterium]
MRRLPLLVLLVIAAGCGSKEPAPPVETPAGFTTRSVQKPAFSIALPRSWRSYDAQSRRDAQAVAGRSAAMRAELELLSRPDTPIKLIGIAPSPRGTFVTNMNVLETQVPSELGFDDLAKNEARQIKAAAKVKAIRQDETRVPAGRTLRLRYRARSGAVLHQYFVRHGDFLYILTYTTSPAGLARYAKIFDMSAHTFEVP